MINGVRLCNLRFADGIALLAESGEKLNDMLYDLNKGKKDKVELNKKMTKSMCNEVARIRPRSDDRWRAIKRKETKYKYLGRLITYGNEMSKEIG